MNYEKQSETAGFIKKFQKWWFDHPIQKSIFRIYESLY